LDSGRELGEGETMAGKRTLSDTSPDPSTWSVADADAAASTLKDALARVGLVLPSVGPDFASVQNPLVSLGRCRPDVAVNLAACLDELANRREEAPQCSTQTEQQA
jgi:hypothetical protein